MEDSVQEPDPDTSDSETGGAAPKPKKAKYAGNFQYKTKFSKDWQKKWSFIVPSPGDPHSFRCTLCSKNLKCGHQGVADVKLHIATKGHQQLAKGLATQSKLSFQSNSSELADKVSLKLYLLFS